MPLMKSEEEKKEVHMYRYLYLLNYSVLYNIWKTGRKLERLLINIKNVGLFYTLPYPL